MSKKMLIDAAHPEETRVVIVDGARIDELDFESRAKRQLRGNVYLARVTRVEPSLQAAFVEYGGNRHGFLAFSEIHPDYYQIPYEDRIALLEEEEAARRAEEDDEEAKNSSNDEKGTDDEADSDAEEIETDYSENEEDNETEGDTSDNEEAEIAEEQAKTASSRKRQSRRRRYKIQEVIKRGQILLIQVVKEERGNKGAAMTTYLSLAGRYCVLMPNTPRGGGISRKISNASDRKRLKGIVSELDVANGMGVIVRTAGAKRTKTEIKRDYDYLCRLWETTRNTTLESIAPALIHEEGNLVKRSIRDLYNKDISEVLVQGEDAYKTAKSFIKMLMPSHAKNVKQYKDDTPLFLRYHVESQLEDSLEPIVQLKSGGYLVIHPTEALVSVDVNSGRSTKERNVERTALKTNLEAAEEVARQMRLRDLAGLVVIDFIDMDENRNNRSVEKRMKEALSKDRARVQAGRISQFGLMEISRQRRRRSLLEGSTVHCEHCQGVGRRRSVESSALKALRSIEDIGTQGKSVRIRIRVAPEVALYVFNHKRSLLQGIDAQFGMFTELEGDPELLRPAFEIETLEAREGSDRKPDTSETEASSNEPKKKKAEKKPSRKRGKKSDDTDDAGMDETAENEDIASTDDDSDSEGSKKRRRRGRRGGRRRKQDSDNEASEDILATDSSSGSTRSEKEPAPVATYETDATTSETEEPKKTTAKKSTTRRRAPSRKTKETSDTVKEIAPDTANEAVESSEKPKKRTRKPRKKADDKKSSDGATEDAVSTSSEHTDTGPKPARRSTARKKAPARKPKPETTTDASRNENNDGKDEDVEKPKPKKRRTSKKKDAPAPEETPETAAEASGNVAPKSSRRGWWQRKKKD